uniref:DUF1758 domain-containing protein n=1 Tax=Heterorhabditis bacteriophora TaxID=37862 RepID=A0A1I7X267_HETBA
MALCKILFEKWEFFAVGVEMRKTIIFFFVSFSLVISAIMSLAVISAALKSPCFIMKSSYMRDSRALSSESLREVINDSKLVIVGFVGLLYDRSFIIISHHLKVDNVKVHLIYYEFKNILNRLGVLVSKVQRDPNDTLTYPSLLALIIRDNIGEILKQESTVERIFADNKRIILPSNKLHYGSSNTVNNNTIHRSDNKYNEPTPISSTFSAASNVLKENNLTNKGCAYCLNNSHLSTMCEKYSTPDARKKRSVELKLCFSCLGDHTYKDCKKFAKRSIILLCFTPIVHSSTTQLPPCHSKDAHLVIRGVPLTLPHSHEKPAILIGSDYMWDILDGYSYTILPSGFLLLDTKIGFMLTGKGRLNYINKNILTTNTAVHDKYNEINSLLENFWKLETIGIHENPTLSDDEECLLLYLKTMIDTWLNGLGNHLILDYLLTFLCLSRLHSVFKQLNNNFELMQKYDAIIKEQLTLDIIEPVLNDHKPDSNIIHYLAHHPVVNLQKSTTKVRIVYDASAKTRNNPSLNECLYRGPVLLPDLCGVLLRFRLAPIAISADVEKAFLQITLAPPDREVTRFLWLKDVTQPPTPNNIITYRFTRVPFGIISSPFLLGATIRYHLEQNETTIAHNLWRNFMWIMFLWLQKMLTIKLFEDASMNLREFISNNAEFNEFLKEKGHHIPDISKILGIKWNISTDNLHFFDTQLY